MPAVAAHYQFGQLALANTSMTIRQLVQQNKAMFDLGTQGPDLLFYFRPYQKNDISAIGSAHHQKTGADFFYPLWRDRVNWTSAQTAYLLGLCCHYALDRRCHPFVDEKAPSNTQHQRLESAFDRVVVEKYHLNPKRQQMLPIKGVSINTLCAIYPDVSKARLREAVYTIHHANTLLGNPALVQRLEGVIGKPGGFSGMCMPTTNVDVQAKLMVPILQDAVAEATHLMTLLMDPSTTIRGLQRAMPENFEGVCV